MSYKDNSYNPDESIPYDLRQIYAIDLVGEHLKDVARARKADNYVAYFKSLKDLWIITQHKIKGDKKESKDRYQELLDKSIEIINKYPNVFYGKNKTPRGIADIEEALNNIEMFLYDMLEDAKIFGSKWEDEGL